MLAGWCLVSGAAAQDGRYRPPPAYVSAGKADQAEGARVLDEFRRAGIAGEYWLAFELRVMPRRGAERTLPGRMLGGRGVRGPLTRLELAGQQWLLAGGPEPRAWRADADAVTVLDVAATLQPIGGTDLTIFDLQMPFLHWPDFIYEGLARVRGRPAHQVLLYPPAGFAAAHPGLSGVRVYLDTQFQALVQAEFLGPKGKPDKSLTVLDLKKVGEQWIVKSIDLRNHASRDKTRFNVVAAALDLTLPPEALTPPGLGGDFPAIPAAKVERF